jgi:hypothetical protein
LATRPGRTGPVSGGRGNAATAGGAAPQGHVLFDNRLPAAAFTEGRIVIELQATIPEGISFADLQLSRDSEDGAVVFSMEPIEAICEASGLDIDDVVDGPEPTICVLIAAWYEIHLQRGGEPDPVQEDFLEETRLELERGYGFSYPPGHA